MVGGTIGAESIRRRGTISGVYLGDVIGKDNVSMIKKLANVIVGILMSQNGQFVKVHIVNINPKAVATFFINKNYLCCATLMTSPRATPGRYGL